MVDAFLAHFQADPHWEELSPGRISVLHRRAPGNLDLIAVYFPTGTARSLHEGPEDADAALLTTLRAQRKQCCNLLSAALRPETALAIIAGDFNFVMGANDRFNKVNGMYSGSPGMAEAAYWRRLFPQKRFYEPSQEEMTHDGLLSRVRLDRTYVNQPLCDQFDRRIFAAAWNSSGNALRIVRWRLKAGPVRSVQWSRGQYRNRSSRARGGRSGLLRSFIGCWTRRLLCRIPCGSWCS
jgi:hypothetical protein